MFLSSKNDDVDKILGLSLGGDDYVTKPFSPREVVFCIKAQLRRQQYQSASISKPEARLCAGPLLMERESCRVYKEGQEIQLTGREYLLLAYFMENADKIISKEGSMNRFGENTAVSVIIPSWCIYGICGKR